MKFLIDQSPKRVKRRMLSPLVLGQLQTPLTNYADCGGVFAIDNGAFSGFRERPFVLLVNRRVHAADRCLFVACPDVVGSHDQTLARWDGLKHLVLGCYKKAFVAQNGANRFNVPWHELDCLFIGGKDPWKDSDEACQLVELAKYYGFPVHVGRVNDAKRFKLFHDLGADTCDGNGVGRYDHMLHKIEVAMGLPTTNFDLVI